MLFGTIVGIVMIFLMITFLGLGVILRIYCYNKLWLKIVKIIIGVFGLIYFIIFRYIDSIQSLIDSQHSLEYIDRYQKSILWAKVLLLDLCPFMYVALMLMFIFDYKNKITSYFALWAFIGAVVTIFGGVWDKQLGTNETVIKYIFVGSDEGKLYFFIHAMMLLLGITSFVYSNKYNFIQTIYAYLVCIVYMIYIIVVSRAMGILANVTGTVAFDWEFGQYHNIYDALGFNNWLATMFLSFFVIWLFFVALMTLRYFISKPTQRYYFPEKWYERNNKLASLSDNLYFKQIKTYNLIFRIKETNEENRIN